MSGLPAQLNFYDLALVITPPIVLVAEAAMPLEHLYGCFSTLARSSFFEFFTEIGAFIAIVLSLAAFVVLFSIGQLLLGVTDIVRTRLTRIIFITRSKAWNALPEKIQERIRPQVQDLGRFLDIDDPFVSGLKRMGPQQETFRHELARLGLWKARRGGKIAHRSMVWAAAGYLQQHGAYGHADRFNTLAIFSFCISMLSLFASILSVGAAFIEPAVHIACWAFAMAVVALFCYHRSLQFHRFFATTVASGFLAQCAHERASNSCSGKAWRSMAARWK